MVSLRRVLVELEKDVTRVDTICKCVSVGKHATELVLTVLRLLVLRFVHWFKAATINLRCIEHEEKGVVCIHACVNDCDIELAFSLTEISALFRSLDLDLSLQTRHAWIAQFKSVCLLWLGHDVV